MVGLPSYAPIPSPRPQAEGGAFGSLGGLGSGLAGFVNSPQGGDVLSAIGMSLLSSPRNSPMQALPQLLGGLQDRRFQQQKYDEALKEQERKQLEAQQEREALVVAAKSAGLSEEEARSLAINPTALKMRLDQVQTERANNERNQFMQGLPSLYDEPAQPVQQPANEVSQDSWGALAQEYGWAVPGGEPDTFPMAQTQPQAQPVQPASRNAENLMRMREQEIHRLYAAPDERTRKVIEGRIGQIDKRLEMESQTDTQKNLEWRASRSGLVPGTKEYRDFMLSGGAGPQVINNIGGDGAPGLGKLSADYGYKLDPETRQPIIDPVTQLPMAAPIPGSPAARAIEEEEAAKLAGKRNAKDYAKTVTQDVGIADSYLSEIADTFYGSDGVVGANLRVRRANIAGTPEYSMKQFVDSALSNVTLDTMNRMRETSAAGATGMGNMSDKQLKVIQGVLGQWDPGLPIADQRLILHRLGNFYMDVQFGTKAEREDAVREGRMTPEENEAIEQLYNPETRDLRGRKLEDESIVPREAPPGIDPSDWQYMTPEERALFE